MCDAIPHHNMLNLDSNGRFIATDFNLDTLRSMTTERLDCMFFVSFLQRYGYGALNELIPFNPRYGKVDPPASHLSNGKTVREWRNCGRSCCAGRGGSMQQSTTQVATTKVNNSVNLGTIGSSIAVTILRWQE